METYCALSASSTSQVATTTAASGLVAAREHLESVLRVLRSDSGMWNGSLVYLLLW